MPSWPTNLPQCPTLNGLSEQQQINVLAFQPDVGPPKVRRRSSFKGVDTKTSFRMTTADLAVFNSFFINTLQDGSSSFTWRHPYDGQTYNWWFDPKSPPLIERETNDTFRVSFPLVRFVIPPPANTAIGSAPGFGSASGRSTVTAASRAVAAGSTSANAVGVTIVLASTVALASGNGTASAVGSSLSTGQGTFQAKGTGIAIGNSRVTIAVTGNASGSGSASGSGFTPAKFDSTAITFDSTTHRWDEA